MTPWFVLSYPRSRTAWLATYLTGGGVFAFHEAWKQVTTAAELRTLMQSKSRDGGPVVNVDSVNWLFLPQIQKEFPEARYIRIDRPWVEVEESARAAFGECNYFKLYQTYRRVIDRSVIVPAVWMSFDDWTPEDSLALWSTVTDQPIDMDWHRHMHEVNVQWTQETIAAVAAMGARGEMAHITSRMVG